MTIFQSVACQQPQPSQVPVEDNPSESCQLSPDKNRLETSFPKKKVRELSIWLMTCAVSSMALEVVNCGSKIGTIMKIQKSYCSLTILFCFS